MSSLIRSELWKEKIRQRRLKSVKQIMRGCWHSILKSKELKEWIIRKLKKFM